jgi:YD repeat-containing protein
MTKDYVLKKLKKLKACSLGIRFFKNQKLWEILEDEKEISEIVFDDKEEFNNVNWFIENFKYGKIRSIKFEDSEGYWKKYEYDKNGNLIKLEDSNGYWKKYEYDENGDMIKYEDSNGIIKEYKIKTERTFKIQY